MSPVPIFVTGYMHSGTTLLRKILGNHPLVHPFELETQYFHHLFLIKQHYPHLEDDQTARKLIAFILYITEHVFEPHEMHPIFQIEDAALVDDVLASLEVRDYITIFRRTLDQLALQAGKSYWLEKTPTHIFQAHELIERFPETRIVNIIRDPRDVIASKKTLRGKVWTDRYAPEEQRLKNLALAFDPVWDTLSWKATVQKALQVQRAYPHNIINLTYERLTCEPQETVGQVCAFLGLVFSEDLLHVAERNSAYEKNKASGLDQSSVGRWQSSLSAGEAYVVQRLADSEMRSLDYTRTTINGLYHVPTIFLVLLRSGFDLLRRLYRRWRLGGTRYLVNTIMNYALRAKQLNPRNNDRQ
jgi:omega-hydroxy-beta-dihydromenaquinone-9 sulfotransferase